MKAFTASILVSCSHIRQKLSKIKMNHVAHRTNSILQNPSPHSGMHWLRSPHSAMHWLRGWTGALHILKNHFTSYCAIKWLHSVKILIDLESTHQVLSYDVQYDTSFNMKIWPQGTQFFTSALTMKVTADRLPKIISWMVDHVLLAHQVWSSSNHEYLSLSIFSLILSFDLGPLQGWTNPRPRRPGQQEMVIAFHSSNAQPGN
jgi:hypothetical protein